MKWIILSESRSEAPVSFYHQNAHGDPHRCFCMAFSMVFCMLNSFIIPTTLGIVTDILTQFMWVIKRRFTGGLGGTALSALGCTYQDSQFASGKFLSKLACRKGNHGSVMKYHHVHFSKISNYKCKKTKPINQISYTRHSYSNFHNVSLLYQPLIKLRKGVPASGIQNCEP